jgi:hypothetical protein
MKRPDRAEQLRRAKRAQRARERARGLRAVELRLPEARAARLRAAMGSADFDRALDRFLDEEVIEIDAWPVLRDLSWNRATRFIPARQALSVYERNWRFVDPARLTPPERALIERLKQRFGAGVLNG